MTMSREQVPSIVKSEIWCSYFSPALQAPPTWLGLFLEIIEIIVSGKVSPLANALTPL